MKHRVSGLGLFRASLFVVVLLVLSVLCFIFWSNIYDYYTGDRQIATVQSSDIIKEKGSVGRSFVGTRLNYETNIVYVLESGDVYPVKDSFFLFGLSEGSRHTVSIKDGKLVEPVGAIMLSPLAVVGWVIPLVILVCLGIYLFYIRPIAKRNRSNS